jgi:hypothetical protein
MKIKIEVFDDSVDALLVARLRSTIKAVSDPRFAELYPDRDEISAACKVLIDYYRVPGG